MKKSILNVSRVLIRLFQMGKKKAQRKKKSKARKKVS